jgi:hypothetical protein
VRIFCRGLVLEGLGISVIKAAVHGNILGIAVTVWLLRYAASQTTQQRIVAHDNGLHGWDWYYATGSLTGAMLAVLVNHLIYHPQDGWVPWRAIATFFVEAVGVGS